MTFGWGQLPPARMTMKDFRAILSEYSKIDQTKQKAALATVIQVRGSSYRSPGARMLITDDGRWVGSISGGCLEGDALRKARKVMNEEKPMTITYDTREESNQNLGIALGCNGVIDVLIEPLSAGENAISILSKLNSSEDAAALATIFYSSYMMSEKLLLNENGAQVSQFSDLAFNTIVLNDLKDVLETRKSFTREYYFKGEQIQVFIEFIQPTISVIIFGGGFDARPVSQLCKALGWKVTVTDECIAHIAPVFFPAADQLSLCQRDFVDRDFDITPHTACILMSHNYEYDRDVLKKLLKTETPYIGILGPRKRFDKMLAEFERESITVTAHDYERIHSPLGLDIGAETPDEIAVSVIAEIQAKLYKRSGGYLKYRDSPIHERDENNSQVLKQPYF